MHYSLIFKRGASQNATLLSEVIFLYKDCYYYDAQPITALWQHCEVQKVFNSVARWIKSTSNTGRGILLVAFS